MPPVRVTALFRVWRARRHLPSAAPCDRPWVARQARTVAGIAAALSLASAAVAAVGPAHEARAVYAWPPSALPGTRPAAGWYAPLPLLNRVPSSIELRVPCELPPSLGAGPRTTVLATMRRPDDRDGLRVIVERGVIRFALGPRTLARVPWPAGCPLEAVVADGLLRLPGRTVRLHTRALEEMPIVTGLFTTLDLRAGKSLQVVVQTRAFATSETMRQYLAGGLAVALAVVALGLLAGIDRRCRRSRSLRPALQLVWRARDATDAVVVSVLLVWWIVAPTIFDDGWIWAQQRALYDLGALDSYFASWGLNLPLGYWIEWLQHWVTGSKSDLVFMRLPTLVALLASWPVCRWCLSRVLTERPSPVVRWTLAGVFLVWATAWGMTLRPEPYVSLLTVISLAAMVSFVLDQRLAPLTIAVPAVVLAATAHPAGLVAGAPLIAAVPEGVSWMRAELRPLLRLGILVLVGLSLALTIFTLDADLHTRVGEARLLRQFHPHVEPWWHEYRRYLVFDGSHGGGTAGRRLSVALLILSVLGWLTSRRRGRMIPLSLPARTVTVALVLLVFVPSKLVWHFGTFAAVGSVATAAEVARLRYTVPQGRLSIRSVVALALVGVVALWSWRAPGDWPSLGVPALDLQRISWADAFGLKSYGSLVVAVVLLPALAICARRWRLAGRKTDQNHPIIGWVVAGVAFAVVGVTVTVLVIDAAITPWSIARQNLEALDGRKSCGLADQLRSESDQASLLTTRKTVTLLSPPVALYFPCATIPSLKDGVVQIPRLGVFWWSKWPVEARDGPFASLRDLYDLRTIAHGPRGVEVVEFPLRIPGFARLDAERRDRPHATSAADIRSGA